MTSRSVCQRDSRAGLVGWLPERHVICGGEFAGESQHAEAVGPVCRNLEIDDGVVFAERLDGRDLEPAQSELPGDLRRVGGHINEVTDPGNQ